MREKAERAERLKAAVDAFRERGGTLRGLSRASGLAPGSIYRAMKTGEGIGREFAAKICPPLGINVGGLLNDEQDGAPTESRARRLLDRVFLAWWDDLTDREKVDVRRYGDALKAGRTTKSERTRSVPGKRDTPKGSRGKARTS
jgi:AcrR family transcriptional regulator